MKDITHIRHENNSYITGKVAALHYKNNKVMRMTFKQKDGTDVEYQLTGEVKDNRVEVTTKQWITVT